MPFMTVEPVCFIYDIRRGIWQRQQLQPYPDYTPFVAPAAAIGSRIYMFGGRQVMSTTLSNDVVVLDIETWSFERIRLMRGQVPRPRHDHTVDVLNRRYLVVFGGACSNSPGENDLHLFDTETNTWNEPRTEGQIPPIRFGHASAVLQDDLYIFGGCQIQPEWNMVHDVLYRLDTETWTWYKYDHPEAYSYRRGDAVMRSEPIADSLRRDLILETTGNPPRDRFYCTMQAIGSHKLVVFGGQTVRQDRDDNNILHAHSLRSIDVFNIRRKHWSAISTTSFDGEHHAYPQDLTCFMLSDNQQDGGYSLLLIGQQKTFSLSTGDSSSGASSGELYQHTGSTPSTGGGSLTHISPPMRPQPMAAPEHDTYSITPHPPTTRQPQPPSLMHAHTSSEPSNTTRHLVSSSSSTATGTIATSPPSHVHPYAAYIPATHHHHHHHHHHHQFRQPSSGGTDALDQRTRRAHSRPVTDYEGFLEHINAYEEYIQNPSARNRGSQQSGSSGDSLASHSLPAPSSFSAHPIESATTTMATLQPPHPPVTTAIPTMQDHPVFSPISEGDMGDQSGGSSSSSHRQHYNIEPLCMMLTLDRE
ncbi:hypothetical protein BDB00DRAFT_972378 [Zychaea mexicana]|uniref:uncharacterized protein n=1 Tax=Zychaea mexicana TaxID=64656 RepID=UPI0022FE0450|nr:uncharacterized protein BDB00DRAFT_972378 [Zychaea mexicana]KAI9495785.1 hypothetical protein BDB00DRAFT_972378 [Zychaea mexicana]